MTIAVTSYYRGSDDPPHTTLFPDSRFYTYASFDEGEAYGMEIKADVPRIADLGLSGFLNYAIGRVWFYNPIVAGFTTEAAHLTESNRFLAPMDQTHTLTSGLRYHNSRTRFWGALALEYGSGTPGGHGGGDHAHDEGATHAHGTRPGSAGPDARRNSRRTCRSGGRRPRTGRGRSSRFSSMSRTCRTRSICCQRRARWCRGGTRVRACSRGR